MLFLTLTSHTSDEFYPNICNSLFYFIIDHLLWADSEHLFEFTELFLKFPTIILL